MAKKRYTSPKYDQFFYRGNNLSTSRKEWNKEMERLLNRAGDWVRKFHAVADIPTKPDRATKSAIERIKQMVWKNVDETTRKQYRKEYEYRYENKMPEIYTPKPPYNPPTETDYYNDLSPDNTYTDNNFITELDEGPDEDGYQETVDSEAELWDWIERVIQSVTVTISPWGNPNEIHGERAKIIQLIESAFNNAKNKFGEDIKFLEYLEENADEFNELTLKAIHGYESGGQIHYIEQGGEQAMGQILTLLNFGAPISQWAEEDIRNGDFSNVFWGSGEDFYQ